jgi:diketogulonate reductase-like aldo/keto reductase
MYFLSNLGNLADMMFRFIPLPKSDTKERIIANFDVFDFELSEEQMAQLNGLDKDEHVCLNVVDCP